MLGFLPKNDQQLRWVCYYYWWRDNSNLQQSVLRLTEFKITFATIEHGSIFFVFAHFRSVADKPRMAMHFGVTDFLLTDKIESLILKSLKKDR